MFYGYIEGLVTLLLASLGPCVWAKPAVEGGRTTADESLTALPRVVYPTPPTSVELHVQRAGLLSQLLTQGLAGAHQTPQLLLTQGVHLVPNKPAGWHRGNWLRCPFLHVNACTRLNKCNVPDNLTPPVSPVPV